MTSLQTKVWVRSPKHSWVRGVIEDRLVQDDGSYCFMVRVLPGNYRAHQDASESESEHDDDNQDSDPELIKVVSKHEEIAGCDDMHLCNEFFEGQQLSDMDDLTWLTHLHEPAILQALSDRFFKDKIYTNTGPILLAVNPFHKVDIYDSTVLEQYRDAGLLRSQGFDAPKLAPHVYAIGDAAYRSLIDINATQMTNQSILVSGESGAGKTETTKYIMKYLATIACDENDLEEQKIADMVLQSNPILEAFGNARTIRNDNSSRFGKFIEMQFNKSGILVGARILTYLLEKVRLSKQGIGERNYHVFYQLARGAPDEKLEEWLVPELESCGILRHSECFNRNDGVRDDDMFNCMWKAMGTMGFPEEEKEHLMRTTSAVMNLGNLQFIDKGDDASELEPSSRPSLDAAAKLLGVDSEELIVALTTRKIKVGLEWFTKSLTAVDAADANEALGKAVYSRMFDRIVFRINESIQCKSSKKMYFIGVLDIFGFEVFKQNSFEQLCINYANETLQQQFNQYVFKLEQVEYEREKIKWSFIDFPDNQKCLDLIEAKPIGILSLLDEQCLFPKGNDKSFASKLYEKLTGFERFSVSNKEKVASMFTVEHYAGNVSYDTNGFLQKNKDQLYEESLQLMMKTSSDFIGILFPKSVASPGGDKARSIQQKSVGSQFKTQLADLLKSIRTTMPHYIRCLKPNDVASAKMLVRQRLVDQLRYGGVLEAVKVARAGYPVRLMLADFVTKYAMLGEKIRLKTARDESEVKRSCVNIAETVGLDSNVEYQVGKTKLFLRKGAYERLESKRLAAMKASATMIQKIVRGNHCHNRYLQKRKSTITLQTAIRGLLARRCVRRMREANASTRIQACVRMMIDHLHFVRMRHAILRLQSIRRGQEGRAYARELRKVSATLKIQSWNRGLPFRKQFLDTRRKVVIVQCLARMKQSKHMLRRLREEAREVGNLQGKVVELEARVKQLEKELAEERARNGVIGAGIVAAAGSTVVTDEIQLEQVQALEQQLLIARETIQSQSEQIAALEEQQATPSETVPAAIATGAAVAATGAVTAAEMAELERMHAQIADATATIQAQEAQIEMLNQKIAEVSAPSMEANGDAEHDALLQRIEEISAINEEQEREIKRLKAATATAAVLGTGAAVVAGVQGSELASQDNVVTHTVADPAVVDELNRTKAMNDSLSTELEAVNVRNVELMRQLEAAYATEVVGAGAIVAAETVAAAHDEARVSELEAQVASLSREADRSKALQHELDETKEKLKLAQSHSHHQTDKLRLARENEDLKDQMRNFIERMCDAENRANLHDEEVQKIRKMNKNLEDKLRGMDVLAQQASGVKIALAKRLETLILENRTLRQEKAEVEEVNDKFKQEIQILRGAR